MFGVKSISVGPSHTLLLTYSGEVYAWGCNDHGHILHHGPEIIKLPMKLPLQGIQSISAGLCHSFALSIEGKVYQWSWGTWVYENGKPVPINMPYNIKEQ
ncbi:hypothetical protein P9112_006389 [Eukaryota sp. TZLM1-RC]